VAKVRVYELAKEFGVESKTVMVKLQEMGEFVRSASSTIEAPVVRRLKEAFGRAAAARAGRTRHLRVRPAPASPGMGTGRITGVSARVSRSPVAPGRRLRRLRPRPAR